MLNERMSQSVDRLRPTSALARSGLRGLGLRSTHSYGLWVSFQTGAHASLPFASIRSPGEISRLEKVIQHNVEGFWNRLNCETIQSRLTVHLCKTIAYG